MFIFLFRWFSRIAKAMAQRMSAFFPSSRGFCLSAIVCNVLKVTGACVLISCERSCSFILLRSSDDLVLKAEPTFFLERYVHSFRTICLNFNINALFTLGSCNNFPQALEYLFFPSATTASLMLPFKRLAWSEYVICVNNGKKDFFNAGNHSTQAGLAIYSLKPSYSGKMPDLIKPLNAGHPLRSCSRLKETRHSHIEWRL